MARDVPESGFEPDIAVLCCERCLVSGAVTGGDVLETSGFRARLVVLPCSSKLIVPYLLRVLERGADGVAVVGCPEGQCRFGVGSRMAEKRVARARALVEEVGLGAERLGMERGASLSRQDVAALAGRRADAVRAMGPSPMKGDVKA